MTIREAVHHYAPMGMSMAAIAGELEIPAHKFRQAVSDEGLRGMFDAKNYASDCKPSGGRGWPKGKPREKKILVSSADLLAAVAKYPTSSDFEVFSDHSYSTVHRRFGSYAMARKFVKTWRPGEPFYHFVCELADKAAVSGTPFFAGGALHGKQQSA